jgi:hypothetical protein
VKVHSINRQPQRLAEMVAAGRRGDAVEFYQTDVIGMPEQVVVGMRQAPFRPALEDIAHTLSYDATIVGDLRLPTELIASIPTPTLVISGENSAPLMRNAAGGRGHPAQRPAQHARRPGP